MRFVHVGYHYTSWQNWQLIRKVGLVPQPIVHHVDLYRDALGSDPPPGIWIYKSPQTPLSSLGCVWWQHRKPGQPMHIVLLSVEYTASDQLVYDPDGFPCSFVVNHDLHDDFLGTTLYWHRREPATLLTKVISKEKVKLLRDWNLERFIK